MWVAVESGRRRRPAARARPAPGSPAAPRASMPSSPAMAAVPATGARVRRQQRHQHGVPDDHPADLVEGSGHATIIACLDARPTWRPPAPCGRLRVRRGGGRAAPRAEAGRRRPRAADRQRESRACRWSRSSAGRTSAGCGSPLPRGVRTAAADALLVRLAREACAPGDVVVDLGCGTGAIAAALLARRARGSRCTPPTSTPSRSRVRGATCRRTGSSRATCTTRCRPTSAGGRRGRRERAVRPDRRHRDDAAGGTRPRAPGRARRRRRRAGRAAAGDRRGTAWLRRGGRLLVETSRPRPRDDGGRMQAAGLAVEAATTGVWSARW